MWKSVANPLVDDHSNCGTQFSENPQIVRSDRRVPVYLATGGRELAEESVVLREPLGDKLLFSAS